MGLTVCHRDHAIGNRGEWSETDRDVNERIWEAAIDGGSCSMEDGETIHGKSEEKQ